MISIAPLRNFRRRCPTVLCLFLRDFQLIVFLLQSYYHNTSPLGLNNILPCPLRSLYHGYCELSPYEDLPWRQGPDFAESKFIDDSTLHGSRTHCAYNFRPLRFVLSGVLDI